MRIRWVILLLITQALPLAAQTGDSGEYVGPSLLSRGLEGGFEPSSIRFRPYINLSAMYTASLGITTASSGSSLPAYSRAGGEAVFGLYGYHSSKKTTIGLEYRGGYRQYNRDSYLRGTDQFLMMGLSHRTSRKVLLNLRQGAGTFTQGAGHMGTFGFYDPTFANIPQNEVLGTRTSYLVTMGDLTYDFTRRLSFNLGGTGFIVRRQVHSFYSVTGASARGDVSYRLDRRSSIGLDYYYTHFWYDKAFGSANIQSVAADYSVRLSRTWHLGFRAGFMRLETLGLGTVQLTPEIAALLGISTGIRAFYNKSYEPTTGLQVGYSKGHSRVFLNAQYGASPGNGVYLTSRQRSVGTSYSYTGLRRWSLTADMRYADMRSVGQDIGTYKALWGGASAVRSFWRHDLFSTFRCELRRHLGGLNYRPYYYSTSIGIAFSPGERPLRLW